jgi:hypothetical protein
LAPGRDPRSRVASAEAISFPTRWHAPASADVLTRGGPTTSTERGVERRIRQFHDEFGPILGHDRDRGVLATVDADRPPDAMHEAVVHVLVNLGEETTMAKYETDRAKNVRAAVPRS